MSRGAAIAVAGFGLSKLIPHRSRERILPGMSLRAWENRILFHQAYGRRWCTLSSRDGAESNCGNSRESRPVAS
jgi:hypothetical protein